MIVSALLHWLVSQSIFFISVTVYDGSGSAGSWPGIATCGYSCIAIMFTIITSIFTLFSVVAIGFRRLRPGIPLVGACSAVISAACHRPQTDELAAFQPLKWGVALHERNLESSVGHCCLSSRVVDMPVAGGYYAGIPL